MLLNEIAPGASAELEVEQNGEKNNLTVTVAMSYESSLLLEAILFEGRVVGFSPESKVSLYYQDEGKVYCWRNVKIAPVKYQGHVYHVVDSPLDSETINRRGAYRVYFGKHMPVTSFTEHGPKTISALIKDISDTGFAYITSEPYKINDYIRLTLDMSKDTSLRLNGKVVRIAPQDEVGSLFLYGCAFADRNRHLSMFLMEYQSKKQKRKRASFGERVDDDGSLDDDEEL